MRAKNVAAIAVMLLGIALVAVSCAETDGGINARVQTNMTRDGSVDTSGISIQTQNRVVTLTGHVDTLAEKDRAIDVARNTAGVVDVVDQLSVRTAEGSGDAPEPDRTLGETIDDAGITMRVKAKLLDDPIVKGLKIDVDTREGIVYLTGSVTTQAERDKAVLLAKETEGVKSVQANLDVTRI